MLLTLRQLVQISPISDAIKNRVMNEESNLTEEDKFKISQICWQTISVAIQARCEDKFDQMLKETAEGGMVYQKEDFDREEDAIIAEFLIKMDQLQTDQKMDDVKAELKKHMEAVKSANANQTVNTTPQGDPSKAVH
jgi:hypothetical protein